MKGGNCVSNALARNVMMLSSLPPNNINCLLMPDENKQQTTNAATADESGC